MFVIESIELITDPIFLVLIAVFRLLNSLIASVAALPIANTCPPVPTKTLSLNNLTASLPENFSIN